MRTLWTCGIFYASSWSPQTHWVETRRTNRELRAGIVDADFASSSQMELWLELGHSNAPSMVSEHFQPQDLLKARGTRQGTAEKSNKPIAPRI